MSKLATKVLSSAIAGLIVCTVLTTSVWAQGIGDYRSVASGNWNAPSIWEYWDGEIWATSGSSPTNSNGVITIRSGHTVTVTENVTIDETIIATGGQIIVASGITLTISNSERTDLEVAGAITGVDATSILNFSGWRLKLSNGVVSIANLVIDDDSDHDIEGTGTFTGCTLDIQMGYLHLSENLSLTGGAIQLADWSSIDLNGKILTLNNATLANGANCDVFDTPFTGKITTRGTTTITQDGSFSAVLEIFSGTTYAHGTGDFSGGVVILDGANLRVPVSSTLIISSDLTIQGSGTLGGANATSSVVEITGSYSGNDLTLDSSLPGTTISNIKLDLHGGSSRYVWFSGVANLQSGASFDIDNYSTLKLADDGTISGGTVQMNSGLIDTYGNTLTLNGTTLNIGSNASVDDYNGEMVGLVQTKGNTTIDLGGYFYVPLQVSSGTTSAWSEVQTPSIILPGSVKGAARVQSLSKTAKSMRARTLKKSSSGDLAQFYGDINVEPGATLRVPSGQTLSVNCENLTVAGTIAGVDNTSHFALDGYGTYLSFNNGIVSIPNFDINCLDETDYIQGTATFTGSTISFAEWAHLQLTDDFTITGGTIGLTNENDLDVYGNQLTLNGTTLNVGYGSSVDDWTLDYKASSDEYSVVGGLVQTNGSTTIEDGGYFTVPLQIYSGTTSLWSQVPLGVNLLQRARKGVPSPSKIASMRATRRSRHGAKVAALDGLPQFMGNIDVNSGATLLIPSGKSLELYYYLPWDYSRISEAAGSTTLGNIQTTWSYDDTTGISFGGLGVWIHTNGPNPGAITVSRTTGAAPSLSGVTSIKRYFDITPSTNSGLNADFKFTYAAGELNGATESGLNLYKSTDGGGSWSKEGGSVNTTSHSITLHGIDSFSRWTAGQAGLVLPTLTNINPSFSSLGSRISLGLTGTNFNAGSTVSFSGTGISVNSVVVNSSTDLTADISISSSAPLGFRTVTVSNAGGSASISNGFQVVYPAPALSGISPNTARRGDVLSVTLTGTGFIGGITSVDFGSGIAADSISVLSATQLRARMSVSGSASTGSRDITVANTGPGGGTAALRGGFTITNPATGITSVTPSVGGRGVTTLVVITGSGFIQGVTSVDFGVGTSVSAIVVSSTTKMTASVLVAREATAGARNITVSNPAPGGGSATLTGGFTVQNPVPSVISASPATGLPGQTMTITVTGVGFLVGATTVDFGAGITVNSSVVDTAGTHITANIVIATGAVAGERTVTATNPGPGGGSGTLSAGFIVNNPAPTLTGINPAVGGKGQTLNVALVGTNFINGTTSVNFGQGVTVNSVVVNSQTSLTANITIGADAIAATRSVTVTNPPPGGGTATLSFAFNVQNAAPTLTSVSPGSATRSQTLNVTLSGTGFYSGVTTVSLGSGITVNSTTVNSPTQMTLGITVAPDAAMGPRDVVVTNPAPGGGSATLTGSFTVAYPVPSLTSLSPNSGTRSQTLTVTLAGSGFYSGVTSVNFGAGVTVNSTIVNSATQMTVAVTVAPDAAMGPRDVAVTNPAPGGGTATLAGSFTVANPTPTITSVVPVSAGRGSLLKITMVGTQFIDGVTSLSFGADISVTNFVVKSSTQIDVNIAINPAATAGSRTITVTNAAPGGGSASLTNGFTITSGPATPIEGELGIIPDQYALQEAYPNPFNPSTRIRYGIPENSRITLIVHNMLGNVVADLVNGERSKGTYELQWHADNLPSGVYLVRMNAESLESTKRFIASRKVVLVK